MTERTSQVVPMACYGKDQKPSNPLCPTCEHKLGCSMYMGSRFGRVNIDQTKFNLLPVTLHEISWTPDDQFLQTYYECYTIMWPNFKPDSLHKRPGLREHVEKEAKKLGCSVRLFLLTVMWGHRLANGPGARFYCAMLSGTAATNRVKRYRADVEANYSMFTEKTLHDYMADSSIGRSYTEQLLDAEKQFGSWVVGFKIRRGGLPEADFFSINEIQMPDIWLAIEPSYRELLYKWRNGNVPSTIEQRKQRSRIAKLIAELKRHSKQAVSVFKARESIMPLAIKYVVEARGMKVSDFKVRANQEHASTPLFWSKLGIAFQHYWVLEYLHGDTQHAARQLKLGEAR